MVKIQVVQGDICDFGGDAIVNAANNSLLGGGGVDGAIHRAAGGELLEECKQVGPCPTGEARITKGYKLQARWVVHTVGPVWKGGQKNEADLLGAAYTNSLSLAYEAGARSIAFPAISTGAYGFPKEQATRIAVQTVREFLGRYPDMEVVFVCFSEADTLLYRNTLAM